MNKTEVISKKLEILDNKIVDKWELVSKLGSGSFGEVYLGFSSEYSKKVAVKLVDMNSIKSQYAKEIQAYERFKNGTGIPELLWHGFESESRELGILVMQLLGASLNNLLHQFRGKFTLRTVLLLADEMLSRLEFIHSNGIIHQDIKPDNFAVGLGPQRKTVYLIDFGLSNPYINSATNKHIEEEADLGLIGSLKYSSVNAQKGNRQSRRDDLESVGYTLIKCLKGHLPWCKKIKSDELMTKRDKVMHLKSTIPLKTLCKNMPVEFMTYMDYCRRLTFKQTPDYEYCRQLFKTLYINSHFNPQRSFDWIPIKK